MADKKCGRWSHSPEETKWNKVNLIVGKQPAMEKLIEWLVSSDLDPYLRLGWGTCHHSELTDKWEKVKSNLDSLPAHCFFFTQSYDCIKHGAKVFGYDGLLSVHRAELRNCGLCMVTYDGEALYGSIEIYSWEIR